MMYRQKTLNDGDDKYLFWVLFESKNKRDHFKSVEIL